MRSSTFSRSIPFGLSTSATATATALVIAVLLAACGGGASDSTGADAGSTADVATDKPVTGLSANFVFAGATVTALPDVTLQPSFHAAPVILSEPDDTDALIADASARVAVHAEPVPADLARLSTKRLTLQTMVSTRREHALGLVPQSIEPVPFASASSVSVFTPAQIRAAYSLPGLPATTATKPTAAQAAQLGAGQTVYIVDAKHNPNAAAELAAFNAKFGLPTCTTKAITSLPLPSAEPTDGCTFSVVYSTQAGGLTTTAPAYDAGWAQEIALDVQWVHATAPLARIVLIEANDASLTNLLGGVRLANDMGPGAVSMSFGAGEGSYTASVDGNFAAVGMTYLAATGDSGSAVSWPAVSPNVLAVGGTRLSYTSGALRSETSWAYTGGGISGYTATPAYQSTNVPGVGALAHRAVGDVSFNADPNTGQYVAVIPKGSTTPSWMAFGGTSLSTPQWAGLVAIANAVRAQVNKAPIGHAHELLYGGVGAVPGAYASAFLDITSGSNGNCERCAANAGYDVPTGLGTPNADRLLSLLTNAGDTLPVNAPVVESATVAGYAGIALSIKVNAAADHAVTYALTGAPSGMTIGSTGIVAWAKPIAGNYGITVKAKDAKNGLVGEGVLTLRIAPPVADPVVKAASIVGQAGTVLGFSVTATSVNNLAFSATGMPSGMTMSIAGVVAWAKPVVGKYSISATAKDVLTGRTGTGVYTVTIAKAPAPTVTAPAMSGVAGRMLTGTMTFSPNSDNPFLSVVISNMPLGMTTSSPAPYVLTVNWPRPVTSNFNLTVTAKNAAGIATTVTVPVKIAAK